MKQRVNNKSPLNVLVDFPYPAITPQIDAKAHKTVGALTYLKV